MTIASMPSPRLSDDSGGLGRLVPKRLTVYEYTRESLRSSILAGGLPEGTRLRQKELAKRLDVSTTPVREALRDLASEGVVHLHPHRGAVVTGRDDTELSDAFEILRLLEPVLIRRVLAHASQPDLAALCRLQDDLDVATDPADWATLEARFHARLDSLARSPKLASLAESTRIAAFRYLGRAATDPAHIGQSNSEHRELIAMLSARRVESAVGVATAHLTQAQSCVLRRAAAVPVGVGRGCLRSISSH